METARSSSIFTNIGALGHQSIVGGLRGLEKRGFDVVRPLSIWMLIFLMMPLVFLPLASIFIFGTSTGLGNFWAALNAPIATRT